MITRSAIQTNHLVKPNRNPESCRLSPRASSLHLANAVNGILRTLFQRDISHSQNNTAEGRCDKWNVVHRNLVELYGLFFGGRVVDRFEDSDQLVMDERACTDDNATICCSWSFLSKELSGVNCNLR